VCNLEFDGGDSVSEFDHNLMKEEHWHHTGKNDRRKKARRTSNERREMIRFELDRAARRTGKDRRRALILTKIDNSEP
jgi:hypothetical protein